MTSVNNNLAHRYDPPSFAQRPSYAEAFSDKPSYTTEKAAEQITRTGYRWKERNQDGTTPISYRFFKPSQATYNTPAGANEFSPSQKEQARRTMQQRLGIDFGRGQVYAESIRRHPTTTMMSVFDQFITKYFKDFLIETTAYIVVSNSYL